MLSNFEGSFVRVSYSPKYTYVLLSVWQKRRLISPAKGRAMRMSHTGLRKEGPQVWKGRSPFAQLPSATFKVSKNSNIYNLRQLISRSIVACIKTQLYILS